MDRHLWTSPKQAVYIQVKYAFCTFLCPTEPSYPLLHVQQLLTGGDRREADKSCEGLASLCHQGLSLHAQLGLALALLDQPLQQGKVSVQEHPLQLPARLATTHTLTHTLGSQRRYTEALQHIDKQTQGFSMQYLNIK